jgi:hypothetical protein
LRSFISTFITHAGSVAGTRTPKGNTTIRDRETFNYEVQQNVLWTGNSYNSLVNVYFILHKIHYMSKKVAEFPFYLSAEEINAQSAALKMCVA